MEEKHDSEESQSVHDDSAGQEHTHESGTDVWSDDQPPVDDFSDTNSPAEEGASVSHETVTETDEVSSMGTSQSRSMLPILAGIGGILVLVAVIYWQFGHSSPPPAMTLPPPTPKSSSSASMNTNAKPAESASKDTTRTMDEADINSLYKAPSDTMASGSAPTSPTTSLTPAPEVSPPNTVPPSPVSPTQPTASTPQQPPVIPVPTPQTATAIPPPVIPATSAPDTRIDTLTSRMEDLQKSLDQATKQLNQLSNVVAANQAMPPVANQNMAALEDRLNKIEQNLTQLAHKEATKTQPEALPSEEPSQTPTKTVTHKTKSVSKHKSVHKKSKIVHHKSQPVATDVASTSPTSAPWVLRAATPTEAWVAADAKSPELRHVQVGDTLAGIGQVRVIHQTQSGWEIEGSAGTVR